MILSSKLYASTEKSGCPVLDKKTHSPVSDWWHMRSVRRRGSYAAVSNPTPCPLHDSLLLWPAAILRSPPSRRRPLRGAGSFHWSPRQRKGWGSGRGCRSWSDGWFRRWWQQPCPGHAPGSDNGKCTPNPRAAPSSLVGIFRNTRALVSVLLVILFKGRKGK